MQSKKAEKIELNAEYPCPCRRRGRLIPIALTEAFGCNRCQQIFVVDPSGDTIEQLSTHYAYKPRWRWTGKEWHRVHSGLKTNYWPLALGMILVPLVIWLLLALHSRGPNTIFWAMVVVLLVILSLMLWLTYRRRQGHGYSAFNSIFSAFLDCTGTRRTKSARKQKSIERPLSGFIWQIAVAHS